MAGEPIPILPPVPQLLARLDDARTMTPNTIASITTSTTTGIILIRSRPWVDMGMVGTGVTGGAMVDPATHPHSGRLCWETPRHLNRDSNRACLGHCVQRKQSTSP